MLNKSLLKSEILKIFSVIKFFWNSFCLIKYPKKKYGIAIRVLSIQKYKSIFLIIRNFKMLNAKTTINNIFLAVKFMKLHNNLIVIIDIINQQGPQTGNEKSEVKKSPRNIPAKHLKNVEIGG